MSTLAAVLAVARADARERMRRYGFLVTLGATVYIGYLVNAGWMSLRLSGYRGVANSAWVGGQMAVIVSSLLTLVGFYLVKGSVARDHETGVGEILATTRLSRADYMLGKLLSNAAVLAAIVAILAVAAVAMQLLAGETGHVDLAALLAPMAFIALPAMVATGGIAVVFESVRPLRGGLGNVVFFFAWMFLLVLAVTSGGWFDLTGVSLLNDSMLTALQAQHPGVNAGFAIQIRPPQHAETFVWEGLTWTSSLIARRLAWVAFAAVLALIAAALFDRFDPARGRPRVASGGTGAEPPQVPVAGATGRRPPTTSLTALPPALLRFSFPALWLSECRLLLAGRGVWWLLVAAGLIAAQLAAPGAAAVHPALVLAWIWPLLVWSPMGCRPLADRVDQVLWSAPAPIARQLPAEWLAGAALAAAAGAGAAVRTLAAGDVRGLAAWASGCLLIPALALALGSLTKSSKTFEIVWLVVWYVGPFQQAPFLDIAGTTPLAVGRSAPLGVALIAAGLVAVAALARRRQLRS